jgi:hypothetical protein
MEATQRIRIIFEPTKEKTGMFLRPFFLGRCGPPLRQTAITAFFRCILRLFACKKSACDLLPGIITCCHQETSGKRFDTLSNPEKQ